MAEALAVIGGISGVIAILDALKTIYDAATDVAGLPKAFRTVNTQLPTVMSILKDVDVHLKTAKWEEADRVAVNQLIEQCEEHAVELNHIFQTAIPVTSDTIMRRGAKAVRATVKAGEVKKSWKSLMEELHVLGTKYGMGAATADQIDELKNMLAELSGTDSEPGSMHNEYHGSGTAHFQQLNNRPEDGGMVMIQADNGHMAHTMNFGEITSKKG